MPKFAFKVCAELDDSYVAFPNRTANTRISNVMIMEYLNDYKELLRNRDTADRIEKLTLLIVGLDFDDAYQEYLDPYIYWPIPETSLHSQLRDACRA